MSEINNKKQYDFFISHAWADPDDDLVDQIVKGLKSSGYKVWYDRDVWGSESGRKNDFLKSGIKNSWHCIPFLSREYFQSENSLFELEYMMKKKSPPNIFPFWSPSINKEFLKDQLFGNELLEIVGIPRGKDNYNPKDLVNRLIILKNSAEGLREYNGIELITEDTRVMEELEVIFGTPIPCITEDSKEKFGFIRENNRVVTLILRERNDGTEISIERPPNSLAKLDSLQELDLSVGIITEAITNLKSLTSLQIYDSKCSNIPESIKDLTSLRELNLSKINSLVKYHKHRIISFPRGITNLRSLETLNVSGNDLSFIPYIPSLKKVDFRNNRFGDIHSKLQSLQYLDLSKNYIVFFPDSIVNIHSLQYLNLSNNLIETLPDSIENLQSLQVLDLSSNKLTSLPESIGNLNSLQKLILQDNHLKSLPESMYNLSNLEIIYISRNPLKKNAKTTLKALEKNDVKVKLEDLRKFVKKFFKNGR